VYIAQHLLEAERVMILSLLIMCKSYKKKIFTYKKNLNFIQFSGEKLLELHCGIQLEHKLMMNSTRII
jgi:hypothetical protein